MTAGLPVLHSISTTQAGYSYPYSLVEGVPGQQGPAGGSLGMKASQAAPVDMKKILNDRQLSIDGIFLRMVKVNNMEKYDYDKINSMHHPAKAAVN